MGFDPRVIVDMIELDQPVVGVIYPKRKFDLTKYEKSLVAGDAPSRARAKALDFAVRGPGVGAQNGFVRVEGCGAGILRLRRDCIATLLDHQPQQSDTSARLTSPTAHGLDRLIRVFDPIRYETVICPRPTPFAIAGGFAETCGPLQTGRSSYGHVSIHGPLQRSMTCAGRRFRLGRGCGAAPERTGPREQRRTSRLTAKPSSADSAAPQEDRRTGSATQARRQPARCSA
jgi:hypothetical protein